MGATPGLVLDDHLCFDLYAASRAVTARYRVLLEPLGLTYPQYLVMVVLWERGAVTFRELGEALQLDSGTLSPLVKRLVDDGLVAKRRREQDERTVQVELTPVGKAMKRRASRVPRCMGEAMGLPADDVGRLRDTLRLLVGNVAV